MKVFMKRFEKLALDFAKKYVSWELQCVSKDSYMAGYKQARLDIEATGDYTDYNGSTEWTDYPYNFDTGEQEVEVEFKDGSHQLIDDISHRLKPEVLSNDFLKEV